MESSRTEMGQGVRQVVRKVRTFLTRGESPNEKRRPYETCKTTEGDAGSIRALSVVYRIRFCQCAGADGERRFPWNCDGYKRSGDSEREGRRQEPYEWADPAGADEFGRLLHHYSIAAGPLFRDGFKGGLYHRRAIQCRATREPGSGSELHSKSRPGDPTGSSDCGSADVEHGQRDDWSGDWFSPGGLSCPERTAVYAACIADAGCISQGKRAAISLHDSYWRWRPQPVRYWTKG